MRGITKTIPQSRGEFAAKGLYDGSMDSFAFHMRGKPSKLDVGDYVYTIWQDELIGRCQITRITLDTYDPEMDKRHTMITVKCPGEKLERPIAMQGHRGTRYTDGGMWTG
jgi:hypothetical protein